MNCLYLEVSKNCNTRFGGLLKLIHEVLYHTVLCYPGFISYMYLHELKLSTYKIFYHSDTY